MSTLFIKKVLRGKYQGNFMGLLGKCPFASNLGTLRRRFRLPNLGLFVVFVDWEKRHF